MQKLLDKQIIVKKGPKGIIYVIEEYCKGCGLCIEFCPLKVLEFAERFNAKGYHPPEIVALEKCSGCDLCGMYCPEFSIWAEKTKGGKNEEG
jgi:2-oxoglutarate ferredoxin oxidoreductase subunit delta